MKYCMWQFSLGKLQIDGLILSGFITTSVKADEASMLIITPEPPTPNQAGWCVNMNYYGRRHLLEKSRETTES